MRRWFLLALLGLTICGVSPSVGADEIYIRNKPFKGTIQGSGHDPAQLRIELSSAVTALGLKLTEIGGNWVVSKESDEASLPADAKGSGKLYVAGKEVGFTSEAGHKFVNLKELGKPLGARFVYNKELDILDVNLVGSADPGTPGLGWGGASASYRLVYFGNDKAPACRHFRPSLIQFEKDSKIPVIWIDTEKPMADLYKNYIRYFEGNLIPYTVLLNSRAQVVKRWTGSIPLGKFAVEARSAIR